MLVVLYGCETRSFTLREEQKLRVSENRVKRKTVGHKREEVTRDRWQLCNEKLYGFYSWPNILRVMKWIGMRWVGHAAQIGQKNGCIQDCSRKPEGKRWLKRSGHRWKDNIKMTQKWGDCTDWIDLAQDSDKWLFTNHLPNSIFHSWHCHLSNNK